MAVTGAAPLTYQWFKDNAGDGDFQSISGAASATYVFSPATLADNLTQVKIRITNAFGQTLWLGPATLYVQ